MGNDQAWLELVLTSFRPLGIWNVPGIGSWNYQEQRSQFLCLSPPPMIYLSFSVHLFWLLSLPSNYSHSYFIFIHNFYLCLPVKLNVFNFFIHSSLWNFLVQMSKRENLIVVADISKPGLRMGILVSEFNLDQSDGEQAGARRQSGINSRINLTFSRYYFFLTESI